MESYLSQFLGYTPSPSRYECDPASPASVGPLIKNLIAPGSKVLDVGCGTGAISWYLQNSLSLDLTCIEPNEHRAGLAKARGLSVINSRLTGSAFNEVNEYDFILFIDVLEHVENPAELVQLAKKLLRPNGRIAICVPNIAHWSIRLKLLMGRFDYSEHGILDATHLRWFTLQSLRLWLHRSGLSIVKIIFTPGPSLSVYSRAPLFSRLSVSRRAKLLNPLCLLFPGLFSCQFLCLVAPIDFQET